MRHLSFRGEVDWIHMGVSINGGTTKMDDLGVPPFQDTPIWWASTASSLPRWELRWVPLKRNVHTKVHRTLLAQTWCPHHVFAASYCQFHPANSLNSPKFPMATLIGKLVNHCGKPTILTPWHSMIFHGHLQVSIVATPTIPSHSPVELLKVLIKIPQAFQRTFCRYVQRCQRCQLVGGPGPPLWKIWFRQLGWWDSQYLGK